MNLNKDEFFDIYREFKPGSTREEFEAEWQKFQEWKAEREARFQVH